MARRTKAEAEATREALLDAAEEVFFEKGVACTSLEQIARHAGMTRGAVYWHFRNKADLFRAMLDRVRMPFEELVAETARAMPHRSKRFAWGASRAFIVWNSPAIDACMPPCSIAANSSAISTPAPWKARWPANAWMPC
ncbi:HTH-type transcriptional repressor BepR [Halomonas elongata]|uniref:HTH-type transcriptional repressor BepR n=1 Tax=Halomonas elongata TaxID=2746 RepID=A0A1B8NUP0_HALEL|nr:HTH-type transcriptional repressor BepR [Halomonas elongata]